MGVVHHLAFWVGWLPSYLEVTGIDPPLESDLLNLDILGIGPPALISVQILIHLTQVVPWVATLALLPGLVGYHPGLSPLDPTSWFVGGIPIVPYISGNFWCMIGLPTSRDADQMQVSSPFSAHLC